MKIRPILKDVLIEMFRYDNKTKKYHSERADQKSIVFRINVSLI